MKNKPIPVIDLFAGPGGLGEGFSSLTNEKGKQIFKIALSIEKDNYAHQTLELRSFFRQFEHDKAPKEYYKHLRRELTREKLYATYAEEAERAKKEAWKAELGKTSNEEIDSRIKEALKESEDWMLIGGPPCQAYSVIGRVRQKLKNGIDENDPRVFLYRQYYRILAVHKPSVFIMENVKGLLSSRLKERNLFKEILMDLENPVRSYKKLKGKDKIQSDNSGYILYSLLRRPLEYDFDGRPDFEPEDFVIRAENYGIPQKRHRIIVLGIRKDYFNSNPNVLNKRDWVKIENVLAGLPRLRSGLSKEFDSKISWDKAIKRILTNGCLDNIDKETSDLINKTVKQLVSPQKDRGSEYINYRSVINYEEKWYLDKRIKGVYNHSTRAHLTNDIYRYLFAACYAQAHKKSPKLESFPTRLLPNHRSVKKNIFNDRFRVQVRNEPARTITSHISKDGHYYIHYDPTQCRSLTVREAARIQTFPDNYYFCGPRTSQYIQVGNAVPPLLAKQIAEIVVKIINNK